MAFVDIEVNGRAYRLLCEPGQEARIADLAGYVDGRLREATGGGKAGSDAMNLLVTCLVLADELRDVIAGRDVLAQRGLVGTDSELEKEAAAMAETLDRVAERVEEVAARLERA
jgi:cell division protein ZapA